MPHVQKELSAYINDTSKAAFLIGIGGVSMCSLAETLFAAGIPVRGSDCNRSESVERLIKKGIPVTVGHKAENVAGADYIIRSAAIHEDNPEIAAARAAGIPVFERAQAWGEVMKGYRQSVCVAGTHGKTTTTSMLTHIALAAGSDPTVMIGGDLPLLEGGHRVGGNDLILMEACEYCNSFLYFSPTVAVILNVEADHLDFFKDLDDVKHSFREFALRTPEDTGLVVYNAEDAGARDCLTDLPRRTVTFGVEGPADYTAFGVTYRHGTTTFEVRRHGEPFAHIRLLVPGRHNVLNALAAIAAAAEGGVPASAIEEGLASFGGAKRRFEFKGEYGGAVIYDDYAHHPHEIHALFDAVELMDFDRIIAVFQPHTYTRTAAFFDEFVAELSRPDLVVLADIYAARETNVTNLSSADLAAKIDGSYYIPDFDDIVEFLKRVARPGDCILTIGAGELNQVSAALAQADTVRRKPDPFDYGVEDGGLRDVSQVEILICHVLQAVGGTLSRHLLDTALQSDGLCSFWGISTALSRLVKNGAITPVEQDGMAGYTLTEIGISGERELKSTIPLAVRERAVEKAAALIAKAAAAAENKITIEKNESGYTVCCTIPDRDLELMTVRLAVSNSAQAHEIKEKFLEDPQHIYQKVLEAFGIQ